MRYAFLQGYLDSLCGVYSIVNAEKIINDSDTIQSQKLFNRIIKYLDDRGDLALQVVGGTDYKGVLDILTNVSMGIKVFKGKKKFMDLNDWWNYSQGFIANPGRAILLSVGGRENHYTAINLMTHGSARLMDSAGIKTIRKSACELKGYKDNDKYIIYPYQCIYLAKEIN